MLETVMQGFRSAKNFLKGHAQLTEKNVGSALEEVKRSLLEADVHYSVADDFVLRIKNKTIGTTVQTRLTTEKGRKLTLSPSEHFVHVCYKELEALMGPEDTSLALTKPLGSILLVGLQGSGKTTTSAKLASYLKKKGKKPLLVAADIYRPAAALQLQTHADNLGVPLFHEAGLSAQDICAKAKLLARELSCDTLIVDTAGRVTIDEALMLELTEVKSIVKPDHIFLVLDAMTGQDAVRTAKAFDDQLSFDGVILSKTDGDARGGAALSIRAATGKPIKWIGIGEELTGFEEFRPASFASRILGMGDVVSLAQDFNEYADDDALSEKSAERLIKGQMGFDDFLSQLRLIKRMGSLRSLAEKLPGMSDLMAGRELDEKQLPAMESIVLSMTPKERRNPALLQGNASRRKRIALGSGRKEAEVDGLLQRFFMMRQMTQQMMGGSLGGPGSLSSLSGLGSKLGALGSERLPMLPGKNPFGFANPLAPSLAPKSHQNNKNKKDKRKREKLARKKNKKK
jgi:signal recognition particle subunit SRP54